jgi:protoheme IX farnesyltransferase
LIFRKPIRQSFTVDIDIEPGILASRERIVFTQSISSYLKLMKPSIMLLVLVTGAASLVLQGLFIERPFNVFLILLGLLLTGGSANAFNMYFERDIDSMMKRTGGKRPLPMGLIAPHNALIFAIMIGMIGVGIFAMFFNPLSAALAFGTIAFYAFFYTLFLKPRTRYNIVIGGAAGSMAPVIAWVAASGSISVTPIILFAIVFLWTPPHFWSLALYIKDDYETVGYPMMPVTAGDSHTRRLILLYTLIVVLFSFLLHVTGAGVIYGLMALAAGAVFVYRAATLYRLKSEITARAMFGYSIIYLFVVFAGAMIDALTRM